MFVNPRACSETELNYLPTSKKKNIAVVGAGPAGMAASTILAGRGHSVTVLKHASEIGGQFNIANKFRAKKNFTKRFVISVDKLELTGVDLKLNTKADVEMLKEFDEVILATGIKPRTPKIEGINHPKVLSYIDVLKHKKEVGKKVAIIGAGGIGFDVAEYITHEGEATSQNLAAFLKEWGIDDTNEARGGIEGITPKSSFA